MDNSANQLVQGFVRTSTGESAMLTEVYLGNTVLAWMSSAILFVVALGVLLVVKRIVIARLHALAQKTHNKLDDVLIGHIYHIKRWIYIVAAVYVATRHLALPEMLDMVIRGVLLVGIVTLVIGFIQIILESSITEKISGASKPPAAFSLVIRVVLWTVGLLLILSNLGVNVNSLIASLGIGGLAVSLALQPVFTDIFSSFSIALDKPFEVGDYIECAPHEGTVKRVGLKTTRIEALRGEEIVIANTELTNARVLNYKKMSHRRVEFGIGVTYDTPKEKMEKIPGMIEEIIRGIEKTEFDRAHFHEFNGSSMDFVVVYNVTTRDKMDHMNIQQEINLGIMDAFAKEGIEMAFPTRTVHLVQS